MQSAASSPSTSATICAASVKTAGRAPSRACASSARESALRGSRSQTAASRRCCGRFREFGKTGEVPPAHAAAAHNREVHHLHPAFSLRCSPSRPPFAVWRQRRISRSLWEEPGEDPRSGHAGEMHECGDGCRAALPPAHAPTAHDRKANAFHALLSLRCRDHRRANLIWEERCQACPKPVRFGDTLGSPISLGTVRGEAAPECWPATFRRVPNLQRKAGHDMPGPDRHTRCVPGGRAVWFTEQLWEPSHDLPVETRRIADIPELDQNCWFGPEIMVQPAVRLRCMRSKSGKPILPILSFCQQMAGLWTGVTGFPRRGSMV